MKNIFSILAIMALSCSPAFATDNVTISAPQDTSWRTHISDATATTTNGWNPSISTVSELSLYGEPSQLFTGIQIRAKYVTGQTLTTNPVLVCFGRKGTSWAVIPDADGSRTITLTDNTNDVTDATNNWTDPSTKIDALGATAVKCSITTAAVASSGAASIEISRY